VSPVRGERVVVVGGGPAGAVTALVLARRGVPVTVLEAAPEPAAKVGETLPPTLAPLLAHLGLDGVVAAGGHLRAHGNRAAWGSAEPYDAPFVANPHGAGWHVDRRRFEADLAAAAVAAGAEWRWGAKLERCVRRGAGWRLALAGGERLGAAFVADATGRKARVARRLGARRVRYDRLVGATALLEPVGGGVADTYTDMACTYTLVEAAEDGWWYSAALADGRLAVAFLGDGDLLDPALRRGDPAAWWRRLTASGETGRRARRHAAPGAVRLAPAETSRLDAITGDGWLAVGDAAAAYDPLSSQGIGSAMGGGLYAGHAIADHLAGRTEALAAYVHLLADAYRLCLDLQRRHYRRERRWPGSPFWSRRHRAGYAVEPLAGAGRRAA